MENWVGHIWSIGYTTYEALGRLHMEHWVGHIWGTGGAVGLIRSYFALFENFDGALGKFKKNGTGFAYNDTVPFLFAGLKGDTFSEGILLSKS
jgi:hypothetical protein